MNETKTKAEAAEYLGISERTLERATKDNKIGVLYERGKTKPVPKYEMGELDRYKAEMEKVTFKPAVEKMAPAESGTLVPAPGSAGAMTQEGLMQILEATVRTTAEVMAAGFKESIKEIPSLAPSADTKRQAPEAPLKDRLFLSVDECAALAGVSAGAIDKAIKAGDLVARRDLARGRRIKRAELEAWATAL